MDSSPRCFLFCPISYHKSIGGRGSSKWRAGRATSSRRRGAGRSESCGSRSSEWEERKKSRAGRGSLCEPRKSRKTVVRTFRVSSRHDTTYDQASLRLHEFRRTSNAAGAHALFSFVSFPPRLSQGLLFCLHAREQVVLSHSCHP